MQGFPRTGVNASMSGPSQVLTPLVATNNQHVQGGEAGSMTNTGGGAVGSTKGIGGAVGSRTGTGVPMSYAASMSGQRAGHAQAGPFTNATQALQMGRGVSNGVQNGVQGGVQGGVGNRVRAGEVESATLATPGLMQHVSSAIEAKLSELKRMEDNIKHREAEVARREESLLEVRKREIMVARREEALNSGTGNSLGDGQPQAKAMKIGFITQDGQQECHGSVPVSRVGGNATHSEESSRDHMDLWMERASGAPQRIAIQGNEAMSPGVAKEEVDSLRLSLKRLEVEVMGMKQTIQEQEKQNQYLIRSVNALQGEKAAQMATRMNSRFPYEEDGNFGDMFRAAGAGRREP